MKYKVINSNMISLSLSFGPITEIKVVNDHRIELHAVNECYYVCSMQHAGYKHVIEDMKCCDCGSNIRFRGITGLESVSLYCDCSVGELRFV